MALHPNGLNDVLFANTIKSDRRATARQESKNDIENHDLALKDFEYEEVERMYHPIFIDPGRKAVYTAAIGLDTMDHQIRRCSTKEYYNLTGSTKYLSRLQRLKNMKDLTIIETNISTQKICSSISHERFIQYIINHKDKLFDFYGVDATLTDNMYFIEVASGNLQCFTKKREAAVDEFKTSRICCRCGTDSLDGVAHVKGHSVLVCKTCNTLWQRDVNAAKNMMKISLSIWKGMGRPKVYSRD
ncbi:hypothetical protein MFLAVUS_002347 [Mucor flavus]|uniref:Cas12f1-like TNB domain-containing protein n=1 Tax=Mucor flavus TaxID=439312 RepID=A0ABP9YQ08_9FUNG